MSDTNIPQDILAMTVEQAIAELETQVAKMEAGGQTLEELTAIFERGILLSKHCREKLGKLERKIQILSRDDGEDGLWEDFDASSGKRQEDIPF